MNKYLAQLFIAVNLLTGLGLVVSIMLTTSACNLNITIPILMMAYTISAFPVTYVGRAINTDDLKE